MPAEVVLPEAHHLAEVLARGGEELAIHVEGDPVDDPAVADRAPLRLPPLPGRHAEGGEIVDDLRRAGHPAAHAAADGVGPRVVLVVRTKDEGGRKRRREARPPRGVEVPVGDVAAILVDRVVVDLIVERKLVDALRGVGVGELSLEHHLVGHAVEVPELALDRIVGRPHRQAGADAHLAIRPVDRRAVERLAPVGQFAESVGHDLHRAGLERQVELLPRRHPLAEHIGLIGEQRPDVPALADRRRLRRALPGVSDAGMLVPAYGVVEQRLGHEVVVEPRPPLRLREERIEADAGEQPQFAVLHRPPQVDPRALLVALLPLRLVVLLEEVHVADPASRAAALPAAKQAVGRAAEVLAMPPERAAAKGAAGVTGIVEPAAIEADVVAAHVADEPGVEVAARRCLEPQERRPVVEQRRAAAGAAVAQVVDVEIPVDAVGRPPPAEDLKGIPAGEYLRAEDPVVLELEVVDVEGRLLGVRRQDWPPEHGHTTERDGVATAGDELLMLDGGLARSGVDRRLTEGPGQWHLLVGELEFPRAELPGGHAEPARRQTRLLGDEPAAVDLPQHVGPQSHGA